MSHDPATAVSQAAAPLPRGREPHPGWWKRLLGRLGPGLFTGASDDDPSGIATYSQAGAQFGYATLWTMLFTYPLMAAVLNGLAAPPIMVVLMIIATKREVMQAFTIPAGLRIAGWATAGVMLAVAVLSIAGWITGG